MVRTVLDSNGARLWPQPGPCYDRGVARSHRLLALLAPGSIEAEVGALQQAVFSELGCVSAIALPPLVPVRFLPAEAPARLPQVPGRRVSAGFTVRIVGPAWSGGHLFLGLDTGGAWTALRGDDRWTDGPPLFPCFEGFYFGCSEPETGSRGALAMPAMDRRFSSVDLALVSITAPDTGADWWREVSWQIDDRRPLRGKLPPVEGAPDG
jgi:hypothetical protein